MMTDHFVGLTSLKGSVQAVSYPPLDVYKRQFYYRLKGKCEPTFSEGLEVERIFKKYGITDIWGE